MDDRTAETALSLTKFGIGQPVRRSEDPTLVRGEGCYADDVNRPGQAYAVLVRSSIAHGIIRSIDTAAAKAMPGVLAVLTAADLAGYGGLKCGLPLKNRDGSPIHYVPRPALASRQGALCRRSGRLRDRRDGGAGQGRRRSGRLDIEPLPVVLKPADAVKPGAPLVFDEVPNNIALDYHYGDARRSTRPSPRPSTSRGWKPPTSA